MALGNRPLLILPDWPNLRQLFWEGNRLVCHRPLFRRWRWKPWEGGLPPGQARFLPWWRGSPTGVGWSAQTGAPGSASKRSPGSGSTSTPSADCACASAALRSQPPPTWTPAWWPTAQLPPLLSETTYGPPAQQHTRTNYRAAQHFRCLFRGCLKVLCRHFYPKRHTSKTQTKGKINSNIWIKHYKFKSKINDKIKLEAKIIVEMAKMIASVCQNYDQSNSFFFFCKG